ncbi:glutathione S-transferase N-terminal domain-containing protein, partial [Salmonella sp. s55044]|uniref:glutathione S-transferase N-terminal domain-containing protein n=1 Tax=Salmonella sp. s55044 TaxID=3159677 RepID=UPI003981761B
MVLTLYFHPYSSPCRSVWMFCKAAGIPIIEKVLDITSGEHKKPWFLLINPFGQIPSIKDSN